jgi:hypothetical protein
MLEAGMVCSRDYKALNWVWEEGERGEGEGTKAGQKKSMCRRARKRCRDRDVEEQVIAEFVVGWPRVYMRVGDKFRWGGARDRGG